MAKVLMSNVLKSCDRRVARIYNSSKSVKSDRKCVQARRRLVMLSDFERFTFAYNPVLILNMWVF